MNNTLFSYILDGVGGTKLLQPKHNQLDVNEQITWTHLDAKDPQSKEWLNKELSVRFYRVVYTFCLKYLSIWS
ncbi:hypothetical protein LA02_1332 [Francisella philomiragia]|nr:hypothetical protein LA02_1332 [Francisella philomiragia]